MLRSSAKKSLLLAGGFVTSAARQVESLVRLPALADTLANYKILPRAMDAKQAYDFGIVDRLYQSGQIK
mgnify:CR=1 FL=1